MKTPIVSIAWSRGPWFHDALDHVAKKKRPLAMTEAPPLDQVRSFVEAKIGRASTH